MVKGEDEEKEEEEKKEKEEERMISADDFEGRLAKTLLETCAGMVSSLKGRWDWGIRIHIECSL